MIYQSMTQLIGKTPLVELQRYNKEQGAVARILAKLELTEEERIQAKADMSRMLDYIDQLNELDTSGVEPMTHIFPVYNVFREDTEEDQWSREQMLENAPEKKDGFFQVPRTVE